MSNSHRFYSEEEAQQILSLASRDFASNGMTRDELVRSAAELGISAESIERAEAEIQRRQEENRQAEEERELRRQFGRYIRGKLIGTLSGFGGFVALFLVIWALSGGGYFWPMWVIPWPFLGTLAELSDLLRPDKRELRFERWKRKRSDPIQLEEEERAQSDQAVIGLSCGRRMQRKRNREF